MKMMTTREGHGRGVTRSKKRRKENNIVNMVNLFVKRKMISQYEY